MKIQKLSDIVDLLKESVLSQALLISVVFGTMCYLMVAGQSVPDVLYGFGGTIIGFYFRSKLDKQEKG